MSAFAAIYIAAAMGFFIGFATCAVLSANRRRP